MRPVFAFEKLKKTWKNLKAPVIIPKKLRMNFVIKLSLPKKGPYAEVEFYFSWQQRAFRLYKVMSVVIPGAKSADLIVFFSFQCAQIKWQNGEWTKGIFSSRNCDFSAQFFKTMQ